MGGCSLELLVREGRRRATYAALAHELRDHAVEGGALVAEALLASAEGAEVLGSLGHGVGEELHHHLASRLTANLDVKENLRSWILMVRREIEVGWGAFELGTVWTWWGHGGGTMSVRYVHDWE